MVRSYLYPFILFVKPVFLLKENEKIRMYLLGKYYLFMNP